MSHESMNTYTDATSNQKADDVILNHQESNYTGVVIDQMDEGLQQLSGVKELDKATEDATTKKNGLPDVPTQLDITDENDKVIKKLGNVLKNTTGPEGNGRLIHKKYERKKDSDRNRGGNENERDKPEKRLGTQKVKRALFVVEKFFDIDTSDKERVQIEQGYHYTKNMATDRLMKINS